MKRVLIKAPINSYEGAQMQIEAGAGEFYAGFEYDFRMGKGLTFSGRAIKSCFDKRKTVLTYEDFKKSVDLAHQNGVLVELVANVPSINDSEFISKNSIRENYLDYVKRGIDAGVDRVIVGDLGNLLYLKEKGIHTPITVSTFLACMNKASIRFFEDLGVEKIVLPHPFSLAEIKELAQNTTLKVEIFGHFGCSFLEGTCGLLHLNNEHLQTGIPCRAKYRVRKTGEVINILDVNEDCSLCNLDKIMETGVDSIKTIGRDLDPLFMASITAAYSLAIELFLQGKSKEEVLGQIKEELDFGYWEDVFCNGNRCKYIDYKYNI
ncbi:peptidase U32 family protein [Anaerosporobacter faecicola]|uniref:peptidase U32 family protein n=1 Tax=Anaerosporobacter faecicola TaxID=2718714 RepID=UPI00143B8286|nr:peptidase U32 family protein [Anaerosporobacter faecicola]